MEQLRNYGDERQVDHCIYCRMKTETLDHVPSKVFLDKPYTSNLPVVPACQSCNQGYSLDEEYVACIVECALSGSIDEENITRSKVKKILQKKPKLASRIEDARIEREEGIFFNVETDRICNIILKLARGHAAFELNEPQMDEPSKIAFLPFPSIPAEDLVNFESPPMPSVWPEVGSRAMQRLAFNFPNGPEWIIVQPGRYRYLAVASEAVIVRLVISEYLACEVIWD